MTSLRESELRLYWRATSEMQQAMRNGDRAGISDAADELDVIAQHTRWRRLRVACAAAVASSVITLKKGFAACLVLAVEAAEAVDAMESVL